jgi:hypothetical protein
MSYSASLLPCAETLTLLVDMRLIGSKTYGRKFAPAHGDVYSGAVSPGRC